MLEILKTAFGRLVNSQKQPSSDEAAEEASHWENELALFAPMEFLPAEQHRRTRLEPPDSAAGHPPGNQERSIAAPSRELADTAERD